MKKPGTITHGDDIGAGSGDITDSSWHPRIPDGDSITGGDDKLPQL